MGRQAGSATRGRVRCESVDMALWLNTLYTAAVMETYFLPALQVLPSQDQRVNI